MLHWQASDMLEESGLQRDSIGRKLLLTQRRSGVRALARKVGRLFLGGVDPRHAASIRFINTAYTAKFTG